VSKRTDVQQAQAGGLGNAGTPPSAQANLPQPPALLLSMPIALRWRDLDAFNHVNNANFLTFLVEARIHWFDSLGGPWVTDAFAPLLAAVQVNYRQPIPYPASLVVKLLAERVGSTSLTIGHRIASADGATLYADGHVVMVWIDRVSGRPIALPGHVRVAAGVPPTM